MAIIFDIYGVADGISRIVLLPGPSAVAAENNSINGCIYYVYGIACCAYTFTAYYGSNGSTVLNGDLISIGRCRRRNARMTHTAAVYTVARHIST